MQSPAFKPPSPVASILLVEDNVRISHEMAQILTAAGMHTRCATDADEMRKYIAQHTPHVVLLDLNLPGEDGISLCKWLRRVHPSIGIVMLTARVMGSDRTLGYQAGADVYLTKPTRPEEILAVLFNYLRRTPVQASAQNLIATEQWVLHVADMRLESPVQDSLRLNLKETLILKTLAESLDPISYQSLLDIFLSAGDASVTDKNQLDVIVSRLRSKLASLQKADLEIATVHKVGYRLSLPLVVKSKGKLKL